MKEIVIQDCVILAKRSIWLNATVRKMKTSLIVLKNRLVVEKNAGRFWIAVSIIANNYAIQDNVETVKKHHKFRKIAPAVVLV